MALASEKRDTTPTVISIEGRCASGKSTLARYISRHFGIPVVKMDDFFLPPERKTKERLSVPGGNVDYERVRDEVLIPLTRDGRAVYSPFSCATVSLTSPVSVEGKTVIVEGVYSASRELEDYYAVKVFLEIDEKEQRRRLTRRVGRKKLERFIREWIPLEEKYFDACDPASRADIIITL